jgi:hypothetical protein
MRDAGESRNSRIQKKGADGVKKFKIPDFRFKINLGTGIRD